MKYPKLARRVSLLAILAAGAASAQIYPPGGYPPGGGYPYPGGGYPGGGYPGGGYPGGGGIPIPGRSGKTKPDTTKGPLPNFRGKLKSMDNKTILLALDDDRTMIFKRNDKTKFFKNGDEIKKPKFDEGDQISVEGPEDGAGNMIAVNVYWEKAAAKGTETASDKDKKDDSSVVDTWKDAPKDAAKNAPATPQQAGAPSPDASAPPPDPNAPRLQRANAPANDGQTAQPSQTATAAPQPAGAPSPDLSTPPPEDANAPRLQRGKPADPSLEHAPAAPVQQADAGPPPSIFRDAPNPAGTLPPPGTPPAQPVYRSSDDDAAPVIPRQGDDLIRRATDAALDFTETLPNYVCTENMTRYESETARPNWQPLDVIGAEVIYENHQESYRNLTRNGRRIDKKMTELDGAWSTGEFGTVLIDLFSPATAADFHYKRDSRSAGIVAKVYDFSVDHPHSHWEISMASQKYLPAYKGSVWIDPATARVLRIEMQAFGFPDDFPTDHVESATDYEYTRLGDAKQYLLPVHSESLSCQRGTNNCSRNAIDFRNYHKYEGESTITFGKDK